MRIEPDETLDGALGGAIRVIQHRRGYRFSLDAVLLADFASPAGGRVADLGTGCGIIAFALAHRSPSATVVGVDLQEALASRAERGVEINQLEGRVSIVRADLRALEGVLAAESFDLVLCNPPYQPVDESRVSPNEEKAIARHESKATLADVVQQAKRLLRREGRLAMVYPAQRSAHLESVLEGGGFSLTRRRDVVPRAGQKAELLLVAARLTSGVDDPIGAGIPPLPRTGEGRGEGALHAAPRTDSQPAPSFKARSAPALQPSPAGGKRGVVETLPPLILHGEGRDYTPEAARILGEPLR